MTIRPGPVAALLVVLVTVGVLGADTWAPEPHVVPAPSPVTSASAAVRGHAVCSVGEARADGEVTVVAARPRGAGTGPGEVEVERFHEGAGASEQLSEIFPGSAAHLRVAEDDEELTGTQVTWRDGSTTTWREWRIEGSDEVPDVTVAGACAAPSSPRWVVPGMSTAGGQEARLRLTNPYRSAATVRVGFLTPEGAAEPLVLRNLTVPARAVREIVVNDTLPEEDDLAAIVETASGRMSVEGVQFARSAIGGIDGASLLQAAPEAAEAWTVPWVSDGASSSSWLWIANPGQRTAAVELTMHTPTGGELPTGLAEVSVPPGELRRVDLSGTFPEDVPTVGLTARSNGAPVVVSGGVELEADDPAASGLAVQLGAPAPDRSWVVSGDRPQDRDERLHVSNPTGADATLDVAVFTGVAALEPEELQDVEIPAGSSRVLDLSEVLTGSSPWSAFVRTSSGEVVVSRVGRSVDEEGPLRLIAARGISSRVWTPQGAGLAIEARTGLVRQLDTATGAAEPPAQPGEQVGQEQVGQDQAGRDQVVDVPADG